MKTRTTLLVPLLSCLGLALPAPALAARHAPTPSAGTAPGRVVVVQALPGTRVKLSIDGRSRDRMAGVGTLLGPYSLTPGTHRLTFAGPDGQDVVRTSIDVRPGSSSDVVLHRPASPEGDPVVNTYRTPEKPLAPGKARILLAHTATVAPADVSFDGKVVFTDIANGEYADADVPAGTHRVALLPTGVRRNPFLGPLTVSLAPRTASMVYAVGTPRNRSMSAIVHTVTVAADGSTAPRTIDTGSAGLVSRVRIRTFTTAATPVTARHDLRTVTVHGAALAC